MNEKNRSARLSPITIGLIGILIIACSFALKGCQPESEDPFPLTQLDPLDPITEHDIDLALTQITQSLSVYQAEVPFEGTMLMGQAQDDIAELLKDAECAMHGLVGGLWSEKGQFRGVYIDLKRHYRGALKGKLRPRPGTAGGVFFGDWQDPTGAFGRLRGEYHENRFQGIWMETDNDTGKWENPDGTVAGIHHPMNKNGGYFFGLWNKCAHNEGEYQCPAGARYATNGHGLAFCLWEDLELPKTDDLEPYCHYLKDGYFGFSWPETELTSRYDCPDGMRYAPNGAGHGYCLIENLLPLPDDVKPYCHWLEDGYIGYHWPLR